MLNDLPAELLPLIAEFLPLLELRCIAQLSKKYQRLLNRTHHRRRYATVIVKYEDETFPEELTQAGTSIKFATLLNNPELLNLVKINCERLITVPPDNWRIEDFQETAELLLTVALLFQNSNVKYFEAWQVGVMGYGFPHSDRKCAQWLKNIMNYIKERTSRKDWVVDSLGVAEAPGGAIFGFEGYEDPNDAPEPEWIAYDITLGPLPLEFEVEQDILDFMERPPREAISLSFYPPELSSGIRLVDKINSAWEAGNVAVELCMYGRRLG